MTGTPTNVANLVQDAVVVLLDKDRAAGREMARVLRTTVREVRMVSTVEQVADNDDWDLFLASYDALDPAGVARVFGVGKERGDRKILLYSSNCIRDQFSDLFGQRGLANLLAKNPDVDGAELLVTVQKILLNDIFGLDKYFPWGTPHHRTVISRASERPSVLEEVRTFAASVKIQNRLIELFVTVTDELLTNAVFNAPTDANGAPRFAHLPRTEEVVLGEGESIIVDLCSDGRRLGISVTDPFGSLSPDRVLNYLAKCFRKGQDQVDAKDGGAGLGLYYTFEALSQFVVNIAPERRTEVIGILDVRGTYRDFAQRAKSFNIFVEEE